LENVHVDKVTGKVDFFDTTITSNGRAMVKRSDIAFSDNDIDLERVDYMIFITRHNEIVPPVVRLSNEWGAAAFMLGESVETSAGDPTEAGKQRRVVGTNPFIVGSEEEEGNLFLDILRKNPNMRCFLLNTGKVGGASNGQKITVADSVKIIEMIARDQITWKRDDFWGYEVPTDIPGLDMSRFDLGNYYTPDRIQSYSKKLKKERLDWLSQFEGLNPDIINALKP
jgi:phosphoenolpyruvate carboxykinase (ATP)